MVGGGISRGSWLVHAVEVNVGYPLKLRNKGLTDQQTIVGKGESAGELIEK